MWPFLRLLEVLAAAAAETAVVVRRPRQPQHHYLHTGFGVLWLQRADYNYMYYFYFVCPSNQLLMLSSYYKSTQKPEIYTKWH